MDTDPVKRESIELGVKSNCEVVTFDGARVQFRFPEQSGFLRPGRWEFADRNDLAEHVARLFSLDLVSGGLRGKTVCFGKYDRQAPNGERAFTFGDPILDLITNPAGQLTLGGVNVDLAAMELHSPRYRSGGIRKIDLSVASDSIRDIQVAQAASGQGDFTLVECTADSIELASTNPSQRDFWRGRDHLRFKAWKKNYRFYWSMGAEVETWGHDFNSARIESRYLDTVVNQVCKVVKYDSDSDTNDDYVDEYEWGVNAPQPLRVVSNCSARWHGSHYAGQVEAGPSCYEG